MKVTLQIEIDNIDVAKDILVLSAILDGKHKSDIASPALLNGMSMALFKVAGFIMSSAANYENPDLVYEMIAGDEDWRGTFMTLRALQDKIKEHDTFGYFKQLD